jgi:hypothetical protein
MAMQRPAPIMRFFEYQGLPEVQWRIAKGFYDLAWDLHDNLTADAELSAGLRKLLEARDCMLRITDAALAPFDDPRPP